jgi:26S proteasome regulatory subunit N9
MDARVYAHYYQALFEYSKVKGNPQDYYTNSLLYLTYTPLNAIPEGQRSSLASEIGLAALLGKNIYNFGELLQHPILQSLENTEYKWLPPLLRTFNSGNIPEFNRIFNEIKGKYVRRRNAIESFDHYAVLKTNLHVVVILVPFFQPTLAQNATFLNQKLRIMTLMELVFRLPAKNASASSSSSAAASSGKDMGAPRGRVLTFNDISTGCDLPKDQVEWLLMKALALKVIKGEIDQVSETVRIKWVSPRVLDVDQVKALRQRLAVWQQEVEQTTVFVENSSQQIV